MEEGAGTEEGVDRCGETLRMIDADRRMYFKCAATQCFSTCFKCRVAELSSTGFEGRWGKDDPSRLLGDSKLDTLLS